MDDKTSVKVDQKMSVAIFKKKKKDEGGES